jgi:hypothetical protein
LQAYVAKNTPVPVGWDRQDARRLGSEDIDIFQYRVERIRGYEDFRVCAVRTTAFNTCGETAYAASLFTTSPSQAR